MRCQHECYLFNSFLRFTGNRYTHFHGENLKCFLPCADTPDTSEKKYGVSAQSQHPCVLHP